MKHEDSKQDKAMLQKAVNKHETKLHPGAPKTKLKAGGMVARGSGAAIKGNRFSRDG